VAKSDARGRGQGEWLQPTSLSVGESYVAVREVWIEGTPPTANAADPYTLSVRWGSPQPASENEPNDSPSQATVLAAPGRSRGYLGSAEDKDWFSITSAKKSKAEVVVEPPAGVDVVLFLDETGKRTVDRHGVGEAESVKLEVPGVVGVGRKLTAGKDPRQQPLEALDDSYEVKVSLANE
jgi:hypothetical protein